MSDRNPFDEGFFQGIQRVAIRQFAERWSFRVPTGVLAAVGRQNAAERVAAFLLDIAERQGGLEEFDLPMSRADIGDYLGLTIETVSRIISRLRSQGVIRLESLRSLRILKLGALKAMSS